MSQLGYHPSTGVLCRLQQGAGEDQRRRRQGYVFAGAGGLGLRVLPKAGRVLYWPLRPASRLLSVLQRASLDEAATVPLGFQEATLLVETLTKFIKHHSGLVSDIKSPGVS